MNARSSTVKPCLVCGHPVHIIEDPTLKKPQVVTYDVCEHCDFIRKQPRHHLDTQAEHAQYLHHVNTIENVGYVTMFKRFIAEAIDPFITKGKGLDFGSGPGPVLYELLKIKGFDMAHYDPYFNPNLSVFEARYDLITSTEVFEHLADPQKTLSRLTECLKNKGVLAIMTSFHQKDIAVFLNWWYRRDSTHIAFYTLKTFEFLIEEMPLHIVYTNNKNIIVLQKRLGSDER